MNLFPAVPIVEPDGTASRVFRAQWQTTPAPIGKTLSALVPGVVIADSAGLPTVEFGLIWRSSREPVLNDKLPMVQPDGTPTPLFLRTCEQI